jgi:putative membrane protein
VFTSIAVIVTLVSKLTDFHPDVEPTMLAVLSTMISFAISLRTNTALDRFNEGRRAWSGIGLACRNLALLIWLHVPVTTLTAKELAELDKSGGMTKSREERERAKALIEKRTIINLLEGFAVASKHYLRSEGGIYYEDLFHLVKMLPK